jgi:anthranilate phosphoribosyltransferase
VTSQCGSADVLEELGVRIGLSAPEVAKCVDATGIGFMFAPLFHESFKNVQRIRRMLAKEMPAGLQRRSVFNVLGPLSNPAGATWQIIGVYSVDLIEKFAHALRILGVERALVPFGFCDGSEAGLDEFSTVGETHYAELRHGKVECRKITPEEAGLPRCANPAELKGSDKQGNARIFRQILSGKMAGPQENLVLMNAGAGFYIGNKAESIKEGVRLARDLVRSGAALSKFEEFRKFTQHLGSQVVS